ncbi:serine/threonine-protein kinase [Actinoallomurus vinaceus]|uniref:Serine/threonine-protein kinase n=1 Tax=Actinoallomurus vinaceus TaxID=1080074 RepID=A0ABP8UQ56_9ACTN
MPDPRQLREDEPKRVGSYRLTDYLGGGGQGAVYRGTSPSGQTVAVKVLHRWLVGDNAARRRFVEEMSIARRVAEFGIARVLDVGLDLDVPYVVSEYVPGESLHAVVARHGPRDVGAIIRLAFGTAAGLAAIHRADVVHRAFKPHNVLLGSDGPRMIDFGLARALGASVTGSGVVGTPAYVAPEQVAGQDALPASDVFAWAGTMVFAATGRPPFGDDHVPAVLWRITNAEPVLSGVPDQLVPLLSACLDKDPDRRPSAAELVSALMRLDTPARVGAADDRPARDGVAPPTGAVRSQRPVAAAPARTGPAGEAAATATDRPASAATATDRAAPAATVTDRTATAPTATERPVSAADRPAHAALPDLGKPVPGEEAWIRRPRRRALPLGIAASGAALAIAAALLFVLWPSERAADMAQHTRTAPSSRHPMDVPAVGASLGRPLTLGAAGSVSAVAEATMSGKPVLVAGGQDGDLRVFDRSTGRQIGAPLTGHQGKVTALAVGTLNAGPVVVSGGADHTIRVWDIAAGRAVGAPFTGDTDTITSLATATVNGRSVVVSGSADWSVRRWDMATGHQIGPPILGHKSPVTSVTTATLNGKPVVVAGCAGKMVRAWDIASGAEIGMGFMGHTAALTSVAAATLNGRLVVVSADADRTVRVSDLVTWHAEGPAFPHRPSAVTTVATADLNGRAVVLTGEGRAVHVWDLATRREIIPPLTGPTGPVIWVTTGTVDGVTVAVAGSADGTVRMWRLR